MKRSTFLLTLTLAPLLLVGCGSGHDTKNIPRWANPTNITFRTLGVADAPRWTGQFNFQPISVVRDWTLDQLEDVTATVKFWNSKNGPFLFTHVPHDQPADIDIVVVDHLDDVLGEETLGYCDMWAPGGVISPGNVRVVVTNKARTALGKNIFKFVLYHEFGHALGFAHRDNLDSVMYKSGDLGNALYLSVKGVPGQLPEVDRLVRDSVYPPYK